MNAKTESQDNQLDFVKWLLVVAIVAGGIYANSEYAYVAVLYRALAGVVVGGVAVAIALQTAKGRAVWELAKEARVEVRRVVWPTKQETTQTTLIVVAVVIVVAFILWGLDSGLSWAVRNIIG